MTTNSFFGISLSSPQDRLFWFSRAGRLLFLGYFAYACYTMISSQNNFVHSLFMQLRPGYFGPPIFTESFSSLGGLLLNTLSGLLLCWWYWLVARLFKLCETGSVFSEASVQLLQRIGKLFLLFAGIGLFNQILYSMVIEPSFLPGMSSLELGMFMASKVQYIGFGMFGLQFNGVDLEPIAVALMIFVSIGVIDEGRKVREEQELTV